MKCKNNNTNRNVELGI